MQNAVLFSDPNFFFRVDQGMPRTNSKAMTFPNAVVKTTLPPTSTASDDKVFSSVTTLDKTHLNSNKDSDRTSYDSDMLYNYGWIINHNEAALQVKIK